MQQQSGPTTGDGGTGEHQPAVPVSMAASATLHCLTGCATGEIVGMLVAAAVGLGNLGSVVVSFVLAFVFGYTLSSFPLVRAGLDWLPALRLVLVADTVSILTMEVVDNGVMSLVPGVLTAGLGDVPFWWGMAASLLLAFAAALPVNRWQIGRGRGHALTHGVQADGPPSGLRRLVPDISAGVLAGLLVAFLLGGLVAAAAGR